MKILIIHYRYSITGGPERYLFNIKQVLEDKGHTVIPFSLAYKDNEPSIYSQYFPEPVSQEFHIHKAKLGLTQKIKFLRNFIFNKNVEKQLSCLIKATQPDIAYVLMYGSKLTYASLKACYKNNIPIVHRVSNFLHFCAVGTFLKGEHICEKCVLHPLSLVKGKCVHNSFAQSSITYLARKIEYRSGYLQKIKTIICPSEFTANYFRNSAIFKDVEVRLLPTFYDFPDIKSEVKGELEKFIIYKRIHDKVFCYFGRIAEDKGILCLLRTMEDIQKKGINCTLKLIGFKDDTYSNLVKTFIKDHEIHNIICYDFCNKEQMDQIIGESLFSVIPSLWYDNMPNSLIESQSKAVPVIASRLGSFNELITAGFNGLLFERDNSQDLTDKIISFLNMDYKEYNEISQNSLDWALNYCSKEKHYNQLNQIFTQVIINNEKLSK